MTIKSHNLFVFSDLSAAELELLDPLILWTEVPKGTTLISNKEISTEVFFVSAGLVRATTYSFTGKEVSYQDLGPGEMFGELSAIDNKPRTTSIVAVNNTVIGKMSSGDFWQILESHPAVMRKVMMRLAGLVRFLVSRVYQFSAMSVKDRVRAEILRRGQDNIVDGQKAVIDSMPTHEALANQLATHREAVTKEISYLLKAGYIEKTGKTIVVPDIAHLQDLIEESISD